MKTCCAFALLAWMLMGCGEKKESDFSESIKIIQKCNHLIVLKLRLNHEDFPMWKDGTLVYNQAEKVASLADSISKELRSLPTSFESVAKANSMVKHIHDTLPIIVGIKRNSISAFSESRSISEAELMFHTYVNQILVDIDRILTCFQMAPRCLTIFSDKDTIKTGETVRYDATISVTKTFRKPIEVERITLNNEVVKMPYKINKNSISLTPQRPGVYMIWLKKQLDDDAEDTSTYSEGRYLVVTR